MPAIVDRYSIASRKPDCDARCVLTPNDKEQIREMRATLGISQMSLAQIFGVSKRTIQFVLDPAKLAQNLQRRTERGGSTRYYDRDRQREYMRTHRANKRRLLEEHKPMELITKQ